MSDSEDRKPQYFQNIFESLQVRRFIRTSVSNPVYRDIIYYLALYTVQSAHHLPVAEVPPPAPETVEV
ncbi:MAG TPA: hypothetical protein PKK94_21780, partial [Leptospiraceae bacterium]|nr:hypothetical protein [Leptospiraceae bacterium]